MARNVDLNLDQGTDTVFQLELIDSDQEPMDLTGFRAEASFTRNIESGTRTNIKTEIPYPVTDGYLHLTITGDSSETIKATRYFYDVNLIDSASSIKERVMQGTLTIDPAVTKDA
jgi:hypothetical protein